MTGSSLKTSSSPVDDVRVMIERVPDGSGPLRKRQIVDVNSSTEKRRKVDQSGDDDEFERLRRLYKE
jgi:hypothetical protein